MKTLLTRIKKIMDAQSQKIEELETQLKGLEVSNVNNTIQEKINEQNEKKNIRKLEEEFKSVRRFIFRSLQRENPVTAPTNKFPQALEIKDFEKEVQVISEIGEGTFAKVLKATFQDQLVAVKRPHVNELTKDQRGDFLRELNIIKSLPYHPNIVSLIAVSTHPTHMCIVTPLMAMGSLDKSLPFIKGHPDLINQIAKEIATGMSYLHSYKIIHRDLAARNILLKQDEKTHKLQYLISDFGLARPVKALYYKVTKETPAPIRWTPPEGLDENNLRFVFKSDVWSYGIMLLECLTGNSKPYPEKTIYEVVYFVKTLKGIPTRPDEGCSDDGWNLLRKCWAYGVNDRPYFHEIVQMLDNISF